MEKATIEKLLRAESLLVEYLTDNMAEPNGVFEDIPEIDEARGLLLDALDEIQDYSYITHIILDVSRRNDETLGDLMEARVIRKSGGKACTQLELRDYNIDGFDLDSLTDLGEGNVFYKDVIYCEDFKTGSGYGHKEDN